MKFSIIIPAHNAEEYILKAINSIKAQTFKDYELIVVCDRCTDRTAEVVADAWDVEPELRIIKVDHGCDGPTRSKGIDEARGDWILFMDDDDWWLHEYVLDILSAKLEQVDCDVLCFSFIWQHIGYAHPLGNRGYTWPAVWNKCWRRDFIGNTRFPNIDSFSDAIFHKDMMQKNPRLAIWDMPLYYYTYSRPGSISELVQKGDKNGN